MEGLFSTRPTPSSLGFICLVRFLFKLHKICLWRADDRKLVLHTYKLSDKIALKGVSRAWLNMGCSRSL